MAGLQRLIWHLTLLKNTPVQSFPLTFNPNYTYQNDLDFSSLRSRFLMSQIFLHLLHFLTKERNYENREEQFEMLETSKICYNPE